MKILVVDDERNICEVYRLELEDEGYEVVLATTSEEAMDIFEKEKPDLVTLDIKMSYDDEGIDLLRRMKALNSDVPVVLLTAFDFRDEFAIWAANAYITKSHDLSELKETIRRLS